jgi:hypothetical protein
VDVVEGGALEGRFSSHRRTRSVGP